MKTFAISLKFISEVRATRPPADLSLAEAHIEGIKGRILKVLREKSKTATEEELLKEAEDWLHKTLNVFPRKNYNGIEQIAIPSTWVFGVLRKKVAFFKIKKLSKAVIEQTALVRPSLIGLRNKNGPIAEADIIESTIVSSDIHGKRVALKRFEVVRPPAWTETFYITFHYDIDESDVAKLLAFGRMGAGRTQGSGEFILSKIKEVERAISFLDLTCLDFLLCSFSSLILSFFRFIFICLLFVLFSAPTNKVKNE